MVAVLRYGVSGWPSGVLLSLTLCREHMERFEGLERTSGRVRGYESMDSRIDQLYNISLPPTAQEIESGVAHLRRCSDLGFTAAEYFNSVTKTLDLRVPPKQ